MKTAQSRLMTVVFRPAAWRRWNTLSYQQVRCFSDIHTLVQEKKLHYITMPIIMDDKVKVAGRFPVFSHFLTFPRRYFI